MNKYFVFLSIIFLVSCTPRVIKEKEYSLQVFFCPEEYCLEEITNQINHSQDIKCAFYELNLQELINLLKEKNAKVVIEDRNELEEFQSGYSSALMHNKFCVLDNHTVITGSMNPTERGNYYNNNNIVLIKSKYLAQNYLDEFNELYNDEYGTGKKVRFPEILLNNTEIENYFCPEDNCKLQVINSLKEAKHSIYFMTYSFTDDDVGNLVWNKNYLGLDVKGIMETRQTSQYSNYEDLEEFAILDNNPYTMHHKVFIIDNKTVITGSYNPTKNANERNDENILIIHDEEVAGKFIQEFKKIYNYKEEIPKDYSDVFIYEVLYDAEGSDKGKEYVVIKNKGNSTVNLAYYFLSNNKTNSRLQGHISPREEKKFRPTFSLRNSHDILLLKKGLKIIDYVRWGPNLNAKSGQVIRRKNLKISDNSWVIA